LSKFQQHFRICDRGFEILLLFKSFLDAASLLNNALRAFLIVPEIGRGDLAL
jgi:hypothetical protein